jgi:hypothetical protein
MMPIPYSRHTLFVLTLGAVFIFSMGAMVGGNAAAAGLEPIAENESVPPVGDHVEQEFRGDGFPASVATFAGGLASLGDYGAAVGYASVKTIGVAATQAWLSALVLGTVATQVYRVWRRLRP